MSSSLIFFFISFVSIPLSKYSDTLKSYTADVNVNILMERRALLRNQRTVYRNPRSRVTIRATSVDKFLQPLVAETERETETKKDGQRRDYNNIIICIRFPLHVVSRPYTYIYSILHVYSTSILCTHIIHNIQYVYIQVVNITIVIYLSP